MRILVVGAGGVGSAVVGIAARRDFFDAMVVADYDLRRAEQRGRAARRRRPVQCGAGRRLRRPTRSPPWCREHGVTHVLNAVDPRFVMPIFDGAFAAGADYLDMAMSLSRPHPESPYEKTGVKLGDEQFAKAGEWEAAGRLALAGIGVEPGLSDVFARYAADHLFDEIDEIGVRDGANLEVDGLRLRAVVLASGPPSRSASTRRWCGRRTAAGSRPRRSASPRSSTSRRASARSSA